MDVAVLARHHLGQFATGHRHAPPFGQAAQQDHASSFMPQVTRPKLGRRAALAQVMAQAGKAHGQRGTQVGAHVQHQHQVQASVDLGVVLGALGHAPQRRHFGQQPGQRTTVTQYSEHA